MSLDHLSLVFWGKSLVGSVVCTYAEYLRMLKICEDNNILPISEMTDWEAVP